MTRFNRRTVLVGVGMFVAGVALGCGVIWASLEVTRPPADPLEARAFTSVEVVSGEVGASLQLSTVAEWDTALVGANRAAGVVTQVAVEPGAQVSQGDLLYSVDLRPVVAAEGSVPAFRDVGEGVTGEDVWQVKHLLSDLGFYRGEVDRVAGSATAAAIRAWQKSLGAPQTGVVAAGDVIFVPKLPSRVVLDNELVFRGASLAGGEAVLAGLPSSPKFVLPANDVQAAMIPAGTRVEITSPEGDRWVAFAGDQSRDEASGTVTVSLSGEGDASICGDQCDQVPATDGQVPLSSRIVTVETVTGLVVPSSAIVSGADGQLAVVAASGKRIPVKVISAARGMSVVEGVDAGVKVRVPAGATS